MKMPIQKTVLRDDDLNPDGVRIVVAWGSMDIGTSIFIPCVNTEKAKKQIIKFFKRSMWQYVLRVRIENSKLGVRIWRTI
jgi:hypothetical protein